MEIDNIKPTLLNKNIKKKAIINQKIFIDTIEKQLKVYVDRLLHSQIEFPLVHAYIYFLRKMII